MHNCSCFGDIVHVMRLFQWRSLALCGELARRPTEAELCLIFILDRSIAASAILLLPGC
jgi:hypothetical protein